MPEAPKKSVDDAIGEMNSSLLALALKQNEIIDQGFDVTLTVELTVNPRGAGSIKKSKLEFSSK